MPSPFFRFKQFTIRHDRSSMKVGTDGVLLGAWASCKEKDSFSSTILDVGTGTGLIALMLAQRFPKKTIIGIDIDEASVLQAKENVEMSPFSTRVEIRKSNFKNIDCFCNKYSLISSNPPFYKEETLGGNKARDAARHTSSLPFENLISNAAYLLADDGRFAVIIPYTETTNFISICAANKLYLTRRMDVRSTEHRPFKRTLLEFEKHIKPVEASTLTLTDSSNNRTPQYVELTKDFYL